MSRALVAAALLALLSGFAASPPDGSRIAYVDLQRLLLETHDGRAARARLESLQKSRQAELDKSAEELKTARSNLDRQRLLLKPEAFQARERELADRMVALENTYLHLQQDLGAEQARAIKEITGKAEPLLGRIAAQEGLTLVLEKKEAGVLWAQAALDLTPRLIRAFETASPR
jgi:outer membrane protein